MYQLVSEDSACLDSFLRQGLDATHSGMNKFAGPENPNFKLVGDVIKKFTDNAPHILGKRQQCKSSGIPTTGFR